MSPEIIFNLHVSAHTSETYHSELHKASFSENLTVVLNNPNNVAPHWKDLLHLTV